MNPTIHFHIRIDRPGKDGSVPIYLVFLIDRDHRTKISIGKSAPLLPQFKKLTPDELLSVPLVDRRKFYAWDENTERVTPLSHPANRTLDKEKARAISVTERFELMGRPITIELFQSAFCRPKGNNTFSEYFEKELLEKRKNTLAAGTLKTFRTTISKICKSSPFSVISRN